MTEDSSIFEFDGADPRLMPGVTVKNKDDEYNKKSYQGLIQARTKTSLAVIYDMVRSAALDERKRDAVDGAMMLGAWEFNAPAMNRFGTIALLEDEAEVLAPSLEEGRPEELEKLAQADVKAGHMSESALLLEGVEAEYYSCRRDLHRLKMEIARERADGHVVKDYTGVKEMIANGVPVETVIDQLPVHFQKVLVMCNVSLARDNEHIERDHIERLVANVGPPGSGRYNPGRGSRGPGRHSRAPRADDDEE